MPLPRFFQFLFPFIFLFTTPALAQVAVPYQSTLEEPDEQTGAPSGDWWNVTVTSNTYTVTRTITFFYPGHPLDGNAQVQFVTQPLSHTHLGNTFTISPGVLLVGAPPHTVNWQVHKQSSVAPWGSWPGRLRHSR